MVLFCFDSGDQGFFLCTLGDKKTYQISVIFVKRLETCLIKHYNRKIFTYIISCEAKQFS